MKLFERFENAYCINLDSRPDRLENFNNQVEKFDLGRYTRVSAINGKLLPIDKKSARLSDGELGLVMTVNEIIQDAIEKKYDTILIMEDDCLFSEKVLNLQEHFEVLPKDWDLLYMGGNHNTHVGVTAPYKIDDKILKLHHTYTAHFVGIKNTVFQPLHDKLSMRIEQIDVSLAHIQKSHNAYCFFPSVVKQYPNYSDIQNINVDYNYIIK